MNLLRKNMLLYTQLFIDTGPEHTVPHTTPQHENPNSAATPSKERLGVLTSPVVAANSYLHSISWALET